MVRESVELVRYERKRSMEEYDLPKSQSLKFMQKERLNE